MSTAVSDRKRGREEMCVCVCVCGQGGREGGTLDGMPHSKCENLHFYLLIYLMDGALKQPSINKRHVCNE